MKKLVSTLILATVFLLLGSQCSMPDDDLRDFVEIEINDLIFIDDSQTSFQVDDVLWVNISVPTLLDDGSNAVTTTSSEIRTTFTLQEVTDFDTPSSIALSEDELISEMGLAFYQSDVIVVDSDLIENKLKSRIGIVLKSAGTFSLVAGYSPEGRNEFYFESDSDSEILLSTTIKDADSENVYRFTVE